MTVWVPLHLTVWAPLQSFANVGLPAKKSVTIADEIKMDTFEDSFGDPNNEAKKRIQEN